MASLAAINIQRNSEVYFSTVDIDGGAAVGDMTPRNTWRVEVLAGYAMSMSSATQDITTLESGTTPDRSSQRFNTAINPVDWNFQTYLRPSGITGVAAQGANTSQTGNSKPVCDWFMWQALMSNTAAATGAGTSSKEQSAWQPGGRFQLVDRVGAANVAGHSPNFGSATEYSLYFKMDNAIYQVKNVTVNQAAIDAAIDGIATTSWSGFGKNLIELSSTARNNAVSVFGGTLNDGTTATANGNTYVGSNAIATAGFHVWGSANINGTVSTASFIKNRLSTVNIKHAPSAAGAGVTYTFPITALSLNYNNNISYLTPQELAALNAAIGQFAGSRQITGNFTAYLRAGATESATLLRNVISDPRTNSAQTSNANLQIGGTTAPYVAFLMPAAQFSFPTHQVQDVIGISVDFLAQESTANKGAGDEITIFAST